MKLSFLIHNLEQFGNLEVHCSDPDPTIRQICLLSFSSSTYSRDTLYVSALSTYRDVNCGKTDSLFLLVDDCKDADTSGLPENYIFFHESITANDLYVKVMGLLSTSERVAEAELTISHALFDCTSVSDLIEIASHLLGNPLILQDFTTRSLAYSRLPDSPVDDEILDNLFRLGYVPAELFAKYNYDSVLAQIQNTPQTFLLQSPKKRDRLICRLMIHRQYFGWILTVAYNQPFRNGDMEIMDFLAGALTVFLEKENILPNTSRSEQMLAELLNPGNSYTDASFRKHASGFHWNLSGRYHVITIAQRPGSTAPVSTIMAYKNHLSLRFSKSRILARDLRLIMFLDGAGIAKTADELSPFLEKYDLHAAVSNEFTCITDFRYVYEQTLSVLQIAEKIHADGRMHYFRDYIIYYMIERLAKMDDIRRYCMPELLEVVRYDRKYHTEFSRSKRLSLEKGSASAAAEMLNVHRNTMDYRLRKFNEISGLQQYPLPVTELLMLSYRILDLFPEIVEV
ncbi:PucR-like helix-turn-helix protein [Fusobacterium naviforme]|nr:PucR-like helix-turn-helix protein [Fusobacterium naviforme]STO28573.1 Sugar diacid utilization regulator [Fusobacterium naviforme]